LLRREHAERERKRKRKRLRIDSGVGFVAQEKATIVDI
jgi:hypothetical protein